MILNRHTTRKWKVKADFYGSWLQTFCSLLRIKRLFFYVFINMTVTQQRTGAGDLKWK